MSSLPPAKFFVNRGVVSEPDRPATTSSGRSSSRPSPTAICAATRSSATGPAGSSGSSSTTPRSSTYFTPLSICLNIDSFEHLEFDTRPDQLLVYTLVQGDERVVLEFAPIGDDGPEPPLRRASSSSTRAASSRWSCSASTPRGRLARPAAVRRGAVAGGGRVRGPPGGSAFTREPSRAVPAGRVWRDPAMAARRATGFGGYGPVEAASTSARPRSVAEAGSAGYFKFADGGPTSSPSRGPA